MQFFDQLNVDVAAERSSLFTTPIIGDALRGEITRQQYVAFLREAYYHVSQTVPLLMACGSHIPADKEWLRGAVAHYVDDEYGHEQWILNDITAAGGDARLVVDGKPSLATELMVSYAWDVVSRGNPAGFFGMVYVLEGTSVALATQVAHKLQVSLDLPEAAFSYLVSHGTVDVEHLRFLETLLNRLDNAGDRACVLHCARRFFYLYGEIFRTLPSGSEASVRPDLRLVA